MTRVQAEWVSDPAITGAMRRFEQAGHQIHVVGGGVRNPLLGQPVTDIDMATSARPEQVLALARDAGWKAVPTGIDHGTVTLVLGGRGVEVTTWRRDVKTDGRHAIIAYADSLDQDAGRRDFTMNALYADAQGQVLDPLGQGLDDLRARRVRFIGDAARRIREDYLRILRYFRFHAWYGDQVAGPDPDALVTIQSLTGGLETLSCERIGHEILRLLVAPEPLQALEAMQQTGVLAQILPGADIAILPDLLRLEQQAGAEPDAIRRLAALGDIQGVADRLRLSKKQARRLALVREAAQGQDAAGALAWRHGAGVARDAILLRAARTGTPLPDDLEDRIAQGAQAQFPVKAADLAPLSGPALGKCLRALEERWVASGFMLTREELLQ